MIPTNTRSSEATARRIILVFGLLLIASNLRAPITAVAPLLSMIRESFHLSTSQGGILTTLPLLAFAAVSPFAALLASEYGLERALFGALLLIGGGILVRSAGTAWCLYLGTWIIGCGIAIGNVLLPSLVKRDFPNKVALLTASYAFTMGAAAAVGSIVVVPLSQLGQGWSLALGAMLLLPLLAAIVWLFQLRSRTVPARDTATPPHGGTVWRSALAWQVTLFLGLNSFIYYVAISWLPAILEDAGYSLSQAASLHGLLQLSTALPGLFLVPLINRMKDQRSIAFGVSTLATIGLLGLLAAPEWARLWTVMFGLGAGAAIILGLSFVSLRAATVEQSAALSGMAQGVGYLLAAAGPILVGAMHDTFGGWSAALVMCLALCMCMAGSGLLAGRAIHITSRQSRP